MAGRKPPKRREIAESSFDQARNELFSHILRCGVLEADLQQQSEWFDDTMDYLADRYEYLSEDELTELRTLGQRYCRPVIKREEPQNPVNPTQPVTAS
jgi:hypothetical protein